MLEMITITILVHALMESMFFSSMSPSLSSPNPK